MHVFIRTFSLFESMNKGNRKNCLKSGSPEQSKKIVPIILVHGGASEAIDKERLCAKIIALRETVKIGYKILKDGGTALDAVEAAIRHMEEEKTFNAGCGSALNIDGEVEMDASIMCGSNLNAGAVAVVQDVAHPISLARLVMEETPHVLLAGEAASCFAEGQGVPTLPPGSLVTEYSRKALEEYKSSGTEQKSKNIETGGTVGAVAIDSKGHLAAGTSTGGLTGKMRGRVGDSCIIGSGTYADDRIAAVSMTGHGESISRFCMAHTIVKEIENGKSAQSAVEESLKKMDERLKRYAGAITVTKTGDVGIYYTSKCMAWAYIIGDQLHYGLESGEKRIETIK